MTRRSHHDDRSLAATFAYAFAGLRYAIRTQRTFRIHLIIAAIVALLAFGLGIGNADAAIIMLAMALVIAAELFNTGVEAVVDLLVERNHHSIAQVAKDISAGSVLTTTVAAAVVGALVLGPPLATTIGFAPDLAVTISRWAAAVLLVVGAAGLIRLLRRRIPAPPASVHSGPGTGSREPGTETARTNR